MNAWMKVASAALVLAFGSTATLAGCEVVDGESRVPFDGGSLHRILVEKRSLTTLNSEFPKLNVIERTFKGEIQTCTSCTEKHVTCKSS